MTPNTPFQTAVVACAVAVALSIPTLAPAQAQPMPPQTTPRAQTPAPPPAPAPPGVKLDDDIEDRVSFRLETDDVTRKYDIDVSASNGVVTLSGDVATAAQKARAVELARITGVTRVQDNITVDPAEDQTLADRAKKGLNKAGDAITDAWITTKVSWFFVGEDLLDGSDINVDTSNNVVTLKGRVPSEAARTRAKVLAERTEGVRQVVDQLVIAPAR
jgi:osmotically-inducible protein OsmY